MTAPAILALEIEKTFGSTRALQHASVALEHGEILALLGPSGSGKTTMLRTIAGFEVPDAGTVSIAGRAVAGPGVWVEPDKRRVGMVFQDGALFPHLTVGRNVNFGGPRPGRAKECLELVGLADRARSYPHELSGGERQRVALARALATEPEVVLLDEPFASLDAGLRATLREDVAAILRAAGASALLVTHDQQEALSLADVVTVMRDGRVEQTGSPEEIYRRPVSRWCAEFLGAANIIDGAVRDGIVDSALGRFPADGAAPDAVEVVVRPESLALGAKDAPDAGSGAIPARIVGRSFYGPDQLVEVELRGGLRLHSRRPGYAAWRVGDDVVVWVEGPVAVLPVAPR